MRGIIPRAFQHIFDHVCSAAASSTSADGSDSSCTSEKYLVRASYFEIYNEEIKDLLTFGKSSDKSKPKYLELKECPQKGIYVKDLSTHIVKSMSDILSLLEEGKKNRAVAFTQMNHGSSRSHSVFTVIVECSSSSTGSGSSSVKSQEHIRVGKLNLVDLAGSERQSKTGATGDRLKEATKINLSLSALGNVISALADTKGTSQKYIPYRDSKLTRILQDSLGGNTKTVMCANCGPADYNHDETLSTLRYANRAKNIKNKPKVNQDPKEALLKEYQEEIRKLRQQLKENQQSSESQQSSEVQQSQVGEEQSSIEDTQSKEQLQKLMADHTKTTDQNSKLQLQLQKESESRDSAEQSRLVLESKLSEIQDRLISGEQNAFNEKQIQEARIRKAELDLQARKNLEEVMDRKMQQHLEENLDLTQKYNSLEEEVLGKTKKLKKVWNKFRQIKGEMEDLTHEYHLEKVELMENIRELRKNLKLKELVIENFIPDEYSRLFCEYREDGETEGENEEVGGIFMWDAEEETWFIPKLNYSFRQQQLTGNFDSATTEKMTNRSIITNISSYPSSVNNSVGSGRDRENVIQLELEMPLQSQSLLDTNMMFKPTYLDDHVEELEILKENTFLDEPYLRYGNNKSISKSDIDGKIEKKKSKGSKGKREKSKSKKHSSRKKKDGEDKVLL